MSSDNEETNGIIMMPMTKPAVNALVALIFSPTRSPAILKNGPMIIKAKTPYTMVGIPAKISIAGFAHARKRGEAYSAK